MANGIVDQSVRFNLTEIDRDPQLRTQYDALRDTWLSETSDTLDSLTDWYRNRVESENVKEEVEPWKRFTDAVVNHEDVVKQPAQEEPTPIAEEPSPAVQINLPQQQAQQTESAPRPALNPAPVFEPTQASDGQSARQLEGNRFLQGIREAHATATSKSEAIREAKERNRTARASEPSSNNADQTAGAESGTSAPSLAQRIRSAAVNVVQRIDAAQQQPSRAHQAVTGAAERIGQRAGEVLGSLESTDINGAIGELGERVGHQFVVSAEETRQKSLAAQEEKRDRQQVRVLADSIGRRTIVDSSSQEDHQPTLTDVAETLQVEPEATTTHQLATPAIVEPAVTTPQAEIAAEPEESELPTQSGQIDPDSIKGKLAALTEEYMEAVNATGRFAEASMEEREKRADELKVEFDRLERENQSTLSEDALTVIPPELDIITGQDELGLSTDLGPDSFTISRDQSVQDQEGESIQGEGERQPQTRAEGFSLQRAIQIHENERNMAAISQHIVFSAVLRDLTTGNRTRNMFSVFTGNSVDPTTENQTRFRKIVSAVVRGFEKVTGIANVRGIENYILAMRALQEISLHGAEDLPERQVIALNQLGLSKYLTSAGRDLLSQEIEDGRLLQNYQTAGIDRQNEPSTWSRINNAIRFTVLGLNNEPDPYAQYGDNGSIFISESFLRRTFLNSNPIYYNMERFEKRFYVLTTVLIGGVALQRFVQAQVGSIDFVVGTLVTAGMSYMRMSESSRIGATDLMNEMRESGLQASPALEADTVRQTTLWSYVRTAARPWITTAATRLKGDTAIQALVEQGDFIKLFEGIQAGNLEIAIEAFARHDTSLIFGTLNRTYGVVDLLEQARALIESRGISPAEATRRIQEKATELSINSYQPLVDKVKRSIRFDGMKAVIGVAGVGFMKVGYSAYHLLNSNPGSVAEVTPQATALPTASPTNTPLPTVTPGKPFGVPTESIPLGNNVGGGLAGPSAEATFVPSPTLTNTPTDTVLPTTAPSSTATFTPTNTATATFTPTNTPAETIVPTTAATFTPTNTPTETLAPTSTSTVSPTATIRPTSSTVATEVSSNPAAVTTTTIPAATTNAPSPTSTPLETIKPTNSPIPTTEPVATATPVQSAGGRPISPSPVTPAVPTRPVSPVVPGMPANPINPVTPITGSTSRTEFTLGSSEGAYVANKANAMVVDGKNIRIVSDSSIRPDYEVRISGNDGPGDGTFRGNLKSDLVVSTTSRYHDKVRELLVQKGLIKAEDYNPDDAGFTVYVTEGKTTKMLFVTKESTLKGLRIDANGKLVIPLGMRSKISGFTANYFNKDTKEMYQFADIKNSDGIVGKLKVEVDTRAGLMPGQPIDLKATDVNNLIQSQGHAKLLTTPSHLLNIHEETDHLITTSNSFQGSNGTRYFPTVLRDQRPEITEQPLVFKFENIDKAYQTIEEKIASTVKNFDAKNIKWDIVFKKPEIPGKPAEYDHLLVTQSTTISGINVDSGQIALRGELARRVVALNLIYDDGVTGIKTFDMFEASAKAGSENIRELPLLTPLVPSNN
jgi:hypothetical protein